MVNLTRIYTRTGDGGTTRLGDMSETSKNDLRLHAYADVDEANAQLGMALAHDLEEPVRVVLIHAQNDLFDVGADFCTPVTTGPGVPAVADHPGLRRPARGVVRRVQRRPAEAPLVHPVRRDPRRGQAPRRAHRRTTCRAVGVGGLRRARRDHEPAARSATSTGSPTWSSSWPATSTAPRVTCCGCPAASAAVPRHRRPTRPKEMHERREAGRGPGRPPRRTRSPRSPTRSTTWWSPTTRCGPGGAKSPTPRAAAASCCARRRSRTTSSTAGRPAPRCR